MIRHFVALHFRAGTPADVKSNLMSELASLSDRIVGIADFQVRPNISVEDPLVRGFRDVFWFDFKDENVRDAYLQDEVHQAIGSRIVAELEGGADGVFVCDYKV